jgi:excisionase family DNA binding protein
MRPAEAFKALGVSRSKGYAMLASGELPAIRIGRSIRVPVAALREWVERQMVEQKGGGISDQI